MQNNNNWNADGQQRILLGLVTVGMFAPVNNNVAGQQATLEAEKRRAEEQEVKAKHVKSHHQQPSNIPKHQPHHKHVMGYSRKPR
jgi:hypothetical protein